MANDSNYFFIDGSALTSQVRQLWRVEPAFDRRRLCPKRLISYFLSVVPALQYGGYKRASLYFPQGDEVAIAKFLVVPDPKQPGGMDDMHFRFCGHKLKKSGEFDKWVEENVPAKFLDRFTKSEKGIDIQICCDALKLASAGRIDRLFLMTNDSDFIPLCQTLKEFGSNISILHLFNTGKANSDLLPEADSFHVVDGENLDRVFESVPPADEGGKAEAGASAPAVIASTQYEKPVTEPSDLSLSDAVEDGDKSDFA